MRKFRIALTGDFLDEAGNLPYGDAGLPLLEGVPFIQYRFLTEQAPVAGDAGYWERFYSLEVTPEQVQGIDGLVVLRPAVKARAFSQGAKDLVVIGRSGAGYDKIDVPACTANDVAVFNAPSALNHSTASAALLLMLALAKRLTLQERITREARWDKQAEVMGSELQGRTLGIIGLGHSGRELVRLAEPFGMRVIAFSPHADPIVAQALGVALRPLDDVLREADFVSIHCRLTPETRRVLGRPQFALMKNTAYLINVARGENVDEEAMIETLREGRIAGAGLDVYEVEPLPAGHPLLSLKNVIVTPHWLASTTDVFRATGQAMAEGMLRAARGLVPENVVNADVLARPGFQAKLARFLENQSS